MSTEAKYSHDDVAAANLLIRKFPTDYLVFHHPEWEAPPVVNAEFRTSAFIEGGEFLLVEREEFEALVDAATRMAVSDD